MTDIGGLVKLLKEQQNLKATHAIEDLSASFSSAASNESPRQRRNCASESFRNDSDTRLGEHRVGRHAHIQNSLEEEKYAFPLTKVLPFLRSAQRWTCIRQLIAALLFLRSQDVVHGSISVDSVLALRNTDADVDPDEEEAQGSEWIFKLILPSANETSAKGLPVTTNAPLVGIAPATCHPEPDVDVPSGFEEDSRAFGELALEILGDEIEMVKEFVELPHDHPQALAIVQCSLLAGRKVRLPTGDDEGSAFSDVGSAADSLDKGSATGVSLAANDSSAEFETGGASEDMGHSDTLGSTKSSKRVSFLMISDSREGSLADAQAVQLPSRAEAMRQLALLEEKCANIVCGSAVENIYGVEGVWNILEKHGGARAKVHRCLLQASRTSSAVSSMVSDLEAAMRQDPFVGHAHVALSFGVWEGRSVHPKPRSEVVSLLQGGQGSAAVDAEIMSSLLRGGWLAEAWSFATNALRALDAFDADWPRLLSTLSSEEAERVETRGLCQGLRTLTTFLPGTRRGCKPGHRQLKRTLERLRNVALEKLSLLPVWPLLLPPNMAKDAAKVASQQAAFSHTSTAQFVLWHLASSLPLVASPQDAVTHLLCSWPKGCGALGVHLVQPSGIVLWAETGSTPEPASQAPNTASAASQSPPTSNTTPNAGPSPFTAQVGLTLAALLTQQRLMVFLNYCGAEQGWETHLLRCVGMLSGVVRSAIIPGNPQVLLLMRTDKTLERFVLQPQAMPNSPSRPTTPRPACASPPGLAGLLSGSRTPKSGKEAVVMSSATTVESLITSLHVRSLRNAEFEVLSIICVSDGGQLLLPLRFGPSDLRLLVVLHSLPAEGEIVTMAEGNHFRAQQLHGFSMSKLPTNVAQHVPRHGAVKESCPGPSEAKKRPKLAKQSTFAAAAVLAAHQVHQNQDNIGKQGQGTGIRSVLHAAAARAHYETATGGGNAGRPAPVVPADAAFFFLPHIWEVLLCLETQLLWWKLPYPLNERAATATTESVLSGIDDMISHGTQVHYLCDLPFSAWSWQLIIGKTRLVALVDMHCKHGSPVHGKASNRRPHCIAIVDAWYGDVMRMIDLPGTLFNIIPVTPSVASPGPAQESSPTGKQSSARPGPRSPGFAAPPAESQAASEAAGTAQANAEWQPPYRIGASNNVVVVSVGGRAAFWPAGELVHSKETKESTRQKFKQALRRLSILNMLVVQDANGPVDIEHGIISSGGRDGVIRPAFPATSSVAPAAVHDTPALDWQDCLFLADVAFWSTGGSLHALFHSMVGYNAAVASINPGEVRRMPGRTSFNDVAPPPWAAMASSPDPRSSSRPQSDASSPGRARASLTGVQQVGAILTKGVFITRMQQGQHRRETSRSPVASPSPSLSRLASPRGSFSVSPTASLGASPRASYNTHESAADDSGSPTSLGSPATNGILAAKLSAKKLRRGGLSPRGKSSENDAAARPQTLAQDLLLWAVVEPLPTATWLMEAWIAVDHVLHELRAHLFPLVTQALPVVTALIEACARVAAPIRPVLHDRLQEICEGLTDSTGHTGPKAWGTKQYVPSTVSSFIVNIRGSDGLMIGHGHRPSTPKQQGMVTVVEGTTIAAALQSAVLLSCGDAGGHVACVAMDAHGRRLLVARESNGMRGRTERWVIEFWQVADQGKWTRRQAQQQGGHVHASASPPICSLSEGAVIGFTASESVYAWDCEDGELLFHLNWNDNMPAFGLWCSGDASRIAVATSNAIYLWKDGALVQAMDYRAIVILAEQGHVRGGFGQTGFGQRHLTAAHCNLSSDEDSILGAIVESRWLAVFSLQPRKKARAAYVMAHTAADLLGLWLSTSGVFLLLLPEKVEVWMLPLQTPKHGARGHERVLRRERTGHLLKAVAQSEGEVLHAVFEETFENLTGGVPEVLIALSTTQSQRLRQAVFTMLHCKRILTFNERSRLLICWDAVASAAVGFVLPMPLTATAILTPHWATMLPARGCLRISAACSSRGDTVVLGGGTQWYLWTFEISVTRALLRASKQGSGLEDPKETTSPRERSSPKRRRGRNTISARLAEAEGSSNRKKTITRFTMMMHRNRNAVFELRKAPEGRVRSSGEERHTVHSRFPLLPASPGKCLRPASWWLEKVAGSNADAGGIAKAAQPSRAQSEDTTSTSRAKSLIPEKEDKSKKRPKSAEAEAKPEETSTEISQEETRKATARQGWSLLRKIQTMDDSGRLEEDDAKTTSDMNSSDSFGWRETARMHATRTPPLSCTRTERSKPNQLLHALPSSKHTELHVGTGPERQPVRVPSRPKSRCTPEPSRARSACTPEPARAASAFGRLSITPSNMPDVDLEIGCSHSNAYRSASPAIEVKRWSQRLSQQSISGNDHPDLSRFHAALSEVESKAEQRAASREAQRRGDKRLMLGVSVLAGDESEVQDVGQEGNDLFNWEIPLVSPAAPPALLQPRMKTGTLGSPVKFWPKGT